MKTFKFISILSLMLLIVSCGSGSSKKDSLVADSSKASSSESDRVPSTIDSTAIDINPQTGLTDDNSVNWDLAINEYANYVDEIVALMPKVSNGDTEAMEKFSVLSSKCVELGAKLRKIKEKGEMTQAQQDRLNKILEKYTESAGKI